MKISVLVALAVLLSSSPARADYRSVVDGQPPIPQDGASSESLTRDNIQALPGAADREVTDALRVLPSVTPDALGQNHVRANYADVRTWLDGVPLPHGLSNQLLPLIPTELIGKLELITGGLPAELDGVVGALLLQTALPLAGQEGWAKLTYGTYGTLRPSVAYAGTFGRVSILVSGSYLQTDRGTDTPDPRTVLNDYLRSGQALAKLVYRATARDSFDLTVAYRQATQQVPVDSSLLPLSDAPPGATRGPDQYGNDPTRFVPYDARPSQDELDIYASLAYRHHFEHRGEILAALTFRDSQATLDCDPTRSLGATADPGTICSSISHHIEDYGAMLHYTVGLGRRHLLKVGLRFDDETSSVGYTQYTRDDASFVGGPDPSQTLSGHDHTNVFSLGAFAEDQVTWKKVSVLYGVRYDEQAVFIPGGPVVHFEMPSARIGTIYTPRPWFSLHADLALVWQSPSLDAPTAARALGLIPAGQPVPYNFKAEETFAGEIGVEVRPITWLRAHVTGWGRWSIHPIDDEEVGNTDLKAEYNYDRGGGFGIEVGLRLALANRLAVFGNLSAQRAAGEGFASARYLFTAQQLAYGGWQTFDHEQILTGNFGVDLQSKDDRSHADLLLQYGSGLRTGENNQFALPQHATIDVSVRHRFDLPTQPEVAIDVLNLLDSRYAYRIGNASVIGSAYAPGRELRLRLVVHL